MTGGAGDDIINALAANPLTNAAQTTINSGDVVNGGEGNDTLNITATATNNTSLSGLTVTGVETVNVTGANFLGGAAATTAALTTATTNKAATAADLAAKQSALQVATQQANAADAVGAAVGKGFNGLAAAGQIETAMVSASTATTVATAASRAAVAAQVSADAVASDFVTFSGLATTATAPTGANYSTTQYRAAIVAALTDASGVALTNIGAVQARAVDLLGAADAVSLAVRSTQQDVATAAQMKAAADAVNALTTDAAIVAAATTTTLPTGATYTIAQYNAAALAAQSGVNGVALTSAGAASGAIDARAAVLAADAAALLTYEQNRGDFTLAQLNAAASSATTSATGGSLVTTGVDDSAAIAARAGVLITASAATVTSSTTAATSASSADAAAAAALATAQTNAAAAPNSSVSGSQFTGATQVWLVGADSSKTNLTVGTGQTAGLNGVTGLANTVTFGTTGALAVSGSSGTVDIAGASSGLTISGTGTTGLVLTNNTATTVASSLKTIAVGTSGAAVLDVSSLGQLTSVTISDAGAVTINPKTGATKLASITTTGTGANTVRINTATAIDDVSTPSVNETVNAVVSTGAGADVVNVATTGAGTTTVTTAAGADTVYVNTVGSGAASINTGDDNDTVVLVGTLASYPNLTINAGAGTDALVMAGQSFGALDFLRMNSALSGFETVRFNSAVGALDASKLAIGTITGFTFNNGANVITEVGAAQTLTLARQLAVTATDFVPAASLIAPSSLTATAAGYKVAGGAQLVTAYGGNLTVSSSGSTTVGLTLNGAGATVGLSATGGVGGSTTAPSVAPTATLATSDLQSLTVNLTSARGLTATGTSANAGTELVATFDAGIIAAGHLAALSTLKVNGSGSFSISTGTIAAADVKLTTIDVSGMTLFADLANDGTQATTANRSTTNITLNNNVAETVILGGADDRVNTGSTVGVMDTITGFQVAGLAATPLTVDVNRSDAIDAPGIGGFTKFTTTATTLLGALTAAAATPNAKVVFQFGGDTYVFADNGGNNTLDAADFLVKLTGTVDLDLLIQGGVLI